MINKMNDEHDLFSFNDYTKKKVEKAEETLDTANDQAEELETGEADTPLPPVLKKRKQVTKSLWSTARSVVIVLVTASLLSWAINTYVGRVFYIPSASMESTLQINDRILVNLTYPAVGGLKRGDVIVFKDPGGWLSNEVSDVTGSILVKRIIGLPGDTVECCDEFGSVSVNGDPLSESYVKSGVSPSEVEFNETVPEGMLWVMGDNRLESDDSRYHKDAEPYGKFVPIEDVVGQAVMVTWPTEHWASLL